MIAFVDMLDSTPEEEDLDLFRSENADNSLWFDMALTEPLPNFVLGDFLTSLFMGQENADQQNIADELSLLVMRMLSFRGLDFNIRGTGDLHVAFERQVVDGYVFDAVDDQYAHIRRAIRDDYQVKWHISSFVGQMQGESLTQQSGTWSGLYSRFNTIVSAVLELAEGFGCDRWEVGRERLVEICVARMVTDSLLNLKLECTEHHRFYIPSQIAQKHGLSFRLLSQVIWIEEQTKDELKCKSCLPSVGYRVIGGKCCKAVRELSSHVHELLDMSTEFGAHDQAIHEVLIQAHYNLKVIEKARYNMIGDLPNLGWISKLVFQIRLKWSKNISWKAELA